MAFDGAGTYTLPVNSFNPAAATTDISPTDWNTTATDLASGISTAICKDGQTTLTANIPFGGFKATGLGAPATAGDALRYGTTAANDVLINAGKPAFLVRRTSNQSDVTGAGTLVTVLWDSEIFDRGSNFAANQFVAPVTGIYHLSGSVLIGDLTAAMTSQQLQIVTSNRTYYFNAKDGTPLASGTVSIPFAVDADMDASDTAYINIVVANGAGDTADILGDATFMYSFFSGHLVA